MSFSAGKSKSSSASQQSSEQHVWEGQAPYLQDLYAQASKLLPGMMPSVEEMAPYKNLLPQGADVLSNMMGGGVNPWLGEMAKSGLGQLGDVYTTQIMPGIRDAALGAGQMGGSRGQLMAAQAGNDWTRNASQFISGMYGNAYNQDQNRRLAAAGMAGEASALPFAPLMAFANILGRPTVLGSSQGMSMGKSSGWNLGGGIVK